MHANWNADRSIRSIGMDKDILSFAHRPIETDELDYTNYLHLDTAYFAHDVFNPRAGEHCGRVSGS